MNTKLLLPILALLAATRGFSAESCFLFAERNMGDGEHFSAKTSDAKVVAAARVQIALPIANRQMIVGKIERGTQDFFKWSWRFQDGWQFADMATEVCDATPSYVEKNLDAWLKAPVNFCPWASYVYAECPKIPSGILEAAPAWQARPDAQSVAFRLARPADVTLELRRLDGTLAFSLSQPGLSAGEHALQASTRDLPRGVYRLILKAEGRVAAHASVVVR